MLQSIKKHKAVSTIYARLPSRIRLGASVYYSFRKLIKKTGFLSADELASYQSGQLKRIVAHCWENIRGYREHWEENNFSPDQLITVSDIEKIPFTTKEMIRDRLDDFSCTSLRRLRKVSTGGSTGIPLSFYQQRRNELIELAFIHEIWAQFYPPIDLKTKRTILRGKKLNGPVGYDPLHGLILSSFDLTGETIGRYVEAIEYYKTPLLHAYPSSLHLFTKLVEQLNLKINHRFQAIMLGSEILYDFQVSQIRKVFDAPLVNWYGQGEKTILAGYCNHNTRYHAFPQYGITEIITRNDSRAKSGETGELVGTSFWNYATPFIRYRTRDYAVQGDPYCPECRRHYQLIDEIKGREHEFIVDKKGKLIALTGVSIVCGSFKEVQQFRFYQETMGEITFRYVKKPGVVKVDTGFIQKSLKEKIGEFFHINFQEVDEIERTSSGKMMYLVQKLDTGKFTGDER
ncbi:MAG: phenylacetate--CoA ligase family protein [Bacteroidales bacterium]|nr:phenylacetate--CoA ligase family protein [Bacteroidales bacterium]MBN2698014.1 phenylacetate--CoA ligase family protein [Bacteroidales bacterium]